MSLLKNRSTRKILGEKIVNVYGSHGYTKEKRNNKSIKFKCKSNNKNQTLDINEQSLKNLNIIHQVLFIFMREKIILNK